MAPDSMGCDGATNIRETLSNLNRGTANLAEDSEFAASVRDAG
jgi:hypothetical protein